ncbi:MAG: NfeD family protein [Woeseiaceae bacterium]
MAGLAEKIKAWSQRPARRADKRRWSVRVVMKYALVQLPGTAVLLVILFLIKEQLGMPVWLLWSIVVAWVAKDVILFPLLWRSYDPDFPAEAHSVVGALGVAKDRLAPSGYVRVRGELWRAEAVAAPNGKGRRVRVREVRGLVLIVESDEKPSA